QFSHLWIDLAQRHGLRVDIIDVEWGEGAPVARIEEILTADTGHEVKGVLIVHNETATGVTSDVAAVRRALDAARHPALLYVDGVSSIGAMDFRMEEWQVDLAITGSQKGLMLPPGLGLVCASPKALAARERAKCPRVFFDFGDMIKANATGYFPYTPSIPMLYGLRESLAMLFEEGLDNVFARHRRGGDGNARRRHQDHAWRRRRRSRRALPRQRGPAAAARRAGALTRDAAPPRGRGRQARSPAGARPRAGMSLTRYEPAASRLQR